MSLLPHRLNTRIILIISCILLATGLISGWLTARNQTASLLATMRLNSSIMTRNFAESTAHQMLIQDYADLETFLLKSAELSDIRRLQICEPDGTLIWDVTRSPNGQPQSKADIAHITPPASRSAVIVTDNDRLVIWQPIMAGSLLGWLKADFSLSAIKDEQSRVWKQSLLLTIVWVVCSAGLIILVLRPIVRSISRLTVFAKQLNEQKGEQIDIIGQPLEIVELGESLNEASTKLLATEQQLLTLNADLELRVQDRTARLNETNNELEAFSYSVSHDLRAPLRSIDGFSQALLEDYSEKLDEQGKDYLRRVRAACQRMAGLIDDMLKLSRITRSVITRENVDLSALARSVAEELRRTEPERVVEFIIQDGLTVPGDLPLLQMVLENLLGNAWKFTSRHATAKIEFGISASNGKTEYFVRDDGAGFDLAYADKLFVPFQRLHAYTEFSGTGIGLSIVRRIIRRHGGVVRAEGVPGQGATFYFTLK